MQNNFKNPQDKYKTLYEMRVKRLRKLIDLQAPVSIIGMEARMVSECFRYTLIDRIRRWHFNRCPNWLLWLTSKDYREVCREDIESLDEDEQTPMTDGGRLFDARVDKIIGIVDKHLGGGLR